MSKQVKQMQMTVLENQFQGVNNVVFLQAEKIDAQADNAMRLGLRKKNIRLMMVKNSLLRRVFGRRGVTVSDKIWAGPTVVAWGGDSIKDLSKELEPLLKDAKFKDKLKAKGALAEGQEVTFEQALKMPTRLEAIGELIGMILSPGAQIASALTGPAAQVASQIASIADKKPDEEAAPAA